MNEIDYKWYTNQKFINKALANSKKPSQVNADDYFAIYYTGGYGVLWNFVDNHKILMKLLWVFIIMVDM